MEFSKRTLISERRRVLEIAGVALTALGKFVFMDALGWRLPFVITAVVLWSVYVYYRYTNEKCILRYWGFRTDNFKTISKYLLPFSIIAVVLFVAIGWYQDTINATWHILPLLITYPIWGSIQQFLTIGLVAGNLYHMKMKKTVVIVITATLFSAIHYPSIGLMIGTFILALFYGYVYLKIKNIYALGICHGWLGAIFYYTVVNQDPFQDVFLKYLA